MSESQGFWSYVHKDDLAERGRISGLAKDVVDQYEMMTAERIELFLDKDALTWGDNWREKIDEGLASIAFFIPVMTPRYFMSSECRRELQFFARRATQLGIKELVLPLLYVDVPSIHDETSQDDLINMVRTFHWEDWRELRYMDVATEKYRRGVARLASRLVDANRHAEQTDISATALTVEDKVEGEIDEAPGLIDRLAKAEDTLPRWQVTLKNITRQVEIIGKIMQEATPELQKAKGFAPKRAVARQVARRLGDPTEQIWMFGNEFASQLHDVDDGFRVIIEAAPGEIEKSPESKPEMCSFFQRIRDLSAAAQKGLGSAQDMIDAIAPIEGISRDMRPALRRLRQGLTIIVEAKKVTNEWVDLIEASGVDCKKHLSQ
ncbi:MAG: toll/interleukin-1 receptor domain-containing protein [Deltaproteobacteria bacterium]|nr:toll/interleukin-1 receptor domain-containing protein [Deltaproteobacteria bacterium]